MLTWNGLSEVIGLFEDGFRMFGHFIYKDLQSRLLLFRKTMQYISDREGFNIHAAPVNETLLIS